MPARLPTAIKVLESTHASHNRPLTETQFERLVDTVEQCANMEERRKEGKPEDCEFCRYRERCRDRFDYISEKEIIGPTSRRQIRPTEM